jgi:hypothetical protein
MLLTDPILMCRVATMLLEINNTYKEDKVQA